MIKKIIAFTVSMLLLGGVGLVFADTPSDEIVTSLDIKGVSIEITTDGQINFGAMAAGETKIGTDVETVQDTSIGMTKIKLAMKSGDFTGTAGTMTNADAVSPYPNDSYYLQLVDPSTTTKQIKSTYSDIWTMVNPNDTANFKFNLVLADTITFSGTGLTGTITILGAVAP